VKAGFFKVGSSALVRDGVMMKRGTEEDQDLRLQRTLEILQGLEATPLGASRWRVSPEPFWISAEEMGFFKDLGNHLLAFYEALNTLYRQSARGRLPQWIAQYLDQGKPSELVVYGRMHRFKTYLPGIIRPDLILTEAGPVCTELDSVPGGFGMTACLAQLYSKQGFRMIGGGAGILHGFARMIRDTTGQEHPSLALVISEESKDYLPEMVWLGETLRKGGFSVYVVEPGRVEFTEHGLFVQTSPNNDGHRIPIHVIYRFFELFDLKNIPKSELILYAVKKNLVSLTPPAKAFLEEKLAFALFHHPVLKTFWLEELGKTTCAVLEAIFPRTWLLDPREVPPHAVIPGLKIGDRWVTDWRALGHLSQKERRFVIKPSGFSELAWGSRGVTVGHDVSEKDWQQIIEEALGSFYQTPYILQEFHKGRRVEVSYYDSTDGVIRKMSGRVRLCPYYFGVQGKAELGGILATVCPLDKKLIHGMTDAVMVPCALREKAND
jgi:hypothetical protein